MQEKVELKERVEELEHRCIQLSGETDTIGEPGPKGVGLHRRGGREWLETRVSLVCLPTHRRVHRPLPKPEGITEGATPGERGVHQPAGPGQGGHEGKPWIFLWSRLGPGMAGELSISPSR